jgi:hypothetical protein
MQCNQGITGYRGSQKQAVERVYEVWRQNAGRTIPENHRVFSKTGSTRNGKRSYKFGPLLDSWIQATLGADADAVSIAIALSSDGDSVSGTRMAAHLKKRGAGSVLNKLDALFRAEMQELLPISPLPAKADSLIGQKMIPLSLFTFSRSGRKMWSESEFCDLPSRVLTF